MHKSGNPTQEEQAGEASQDTNTQDLTGDGAASAEVARPLARPLRVTLSSGLNKSKILKNAKNIRKSKSTQFDPLKIFIVPDQTALEREDDLKLRKKLQSKREQYPEKKFIIKNRQVQEIDPANGNVIQSHNSSKSASKSFWEQSRK